MGAKRSVFTACAVLVLACLPATSHAAGWYNSVNVGAWDEGQMGVGASPWGVDVAPDGTVYTVELGARLITYDAAGDVIESFGHYGTDDNGLAWGTQLWDVDYAPDGTVWVLDTSNDRIEHLSADGEHIEYLMEGQVGGAWGFAVAPDGSIWIPRASLNDVIHVDTSGNILAQFGVAGAAAGQFNQPTAIAVAPDSTIYVTDSNNDRVQQFDDSGNFINEFGSAGAGAGQFDEPDGLAFRSDGTLLVADGNNGRIQVFLADGTYVTEFGSFGSGPGQLNYVGNIGVAPDDSVYVPEYSNHRVSVFDSSNNFLYTLGEPSGAVDEHSWVDAVELAADGSTYTVDPREDRVVHFNADGTFDAVVAPSGAGPGQVTDPIDAAIAGNGDLYVVDGDGEVHIFDDAGVYQSTLSLSAGHIAIDADTNIFIALPWGVRKYDNAGLLLDTYFVAQVNTAISGIAVSSTGKIFVVARDDHAIYRLSATGAYEATIGTGSASIEDGEFTKPMDIGFYNGKLAVTELAGTRVQLFSVSTGAYVGSFSLTDANERLVHASRFDAVGSKLVTSARQYHRVDVWIWDASAPSVRYAGTWKSFIPGTANDRVFTISDVGAGIDTITARWRGSAVPITGGGAIDVSALSSGTGVLKVIATDLTGATTTWASTLTVDRSAPTMIATSRVAIGPSTTLRIRDGLSGLASGTGVVRTPKLGRNVVRATIRDKAGNARRVRSVVYRRLSLASPLLNRDVAVQLNKQRVKYADSGAIAAAFAFIGNVAPWYAREDTAPPIVREAQWRLRRLGYLPASSRTTGVLDIPTIRAVQRYQRARGIEALGTIGPKTRAALDADLRNGLLD